MTNSKSKGNSFERKICKTLSMWLSKGETDDLLWRESSSGARATSRAKSNKETVHVGDIVGTQGVGIDFCSKYTIECKKGYKKWSFLDRLDNPRQSDQTIDKFIEQCDMQCEGNHKIPLLICQRDGRIPIVVIPYTVLIKQLPFYNFEYMIYSRGDNKHRKDKIVLRLRDFITINPQVFL